MNCLSETKTNPTLVFPRGTNAASVAGDLWRDMEETMSLVSAALDPVGHVHAD